MEGLDENKPAILGQYRIRVKGISSTPREKESWVEIENRKK